jgi:hypothetical protein
MTRPPLGLSGSAGDHSVTASYWPPLPSDDDLIARIQGAHRRDGLRHALTTGDFSNVDPGIVREALSVEERRALLNVHPHLALGEYLPELEDEDLPEGEVEIARLYLASGAGNTISVRARRNGSKIHLRAVDEYEDRLSITPDVIDRPLTNDELMEAAKTLEWRGPFAHGNIWQTREFEAEVDVEAAAEFITGESHIYPAFDSYVGADNLTWLDEQEVFADGDDEDDEGEDDTQKA